MWPVKIIAAMEQHKIRVLMVDDDPEFTGMVGKLIDPRVYSLTVACDGPEGLAMMAAERPHLAMIDLRLPGLDGLEVCRRVRNDHGYDQVTLILMTSGEYSSDSIVAALGLGIDGFASKSIPLREFLAIIHSRTRVHRLEQELKSSQTNYRYLFDNMPIGLVELKLVYRDGKPVDLEYLTANQAHLTAIAPLDPIGRKVSEIYPGIHGMYPELLERFQHISESGKSDSFEFFFGLMNQWYQMHIYSYKVGYITVLIDDITKQKALEAELRQNEQRFREFAENGADVLWEIDAEGLYTFCSDNIYEITGYRADEMTGKAHFYDFWDSADRENQKQEAMNTIARRLPFRKFVSRNITRDGEVVWFETSGTPVIDENDRLTGYRGTGTDVTLQTKMVEMLRSASERYMATFNNAPVLLILSQSDSGIIQGVNETFQVTTGFAAHEVTGKTMAAAGLIDEARYARIAEEVNRIRILHEQEISFANRNGEILTCLFNFSTFHLNGTGYLISMGRDITLRRKAEEAARRADLLMRQSRMSPHFIFNALNSIQSFILRNDTDQSLHYIMVFSKLIRTVLDYNARPLIPLAVELDFLNHYIQLEKMRFRVSFNYRSEVEPSLNLENTMLPPMVLQPVIQHTIRHGLIPCNHTCDLLMEIMPGGEEAVIISLTDNGCPRFQSTPSAGDSTQEQEPMALRLIHERLQLLNELNRTDLYGMEITELKHPDGSRAGTRVEIVMPLTIDH